MLPLRLIVQDEFLALDRPPQGRFEFELGDGVGVHVRGVEAETVAAVVLGLIHRGVGVAQQFGGRGAVVGKDADADAGADVDLAAAAQPEGLRQDDEEVARDDGGLLGRLDRFEQQQELVAAEAAERVFVAHAFAQTERRVEQQLVAGDVPEAVVYRLEAVEVDEQQGCPLPVPLRAVDRVFQAGLEQ